VIKPKPFLSVKVTLDRERSMLVDWNAMYKIEEAITQRRGGPWVSMQSLGDISKLAIADMRSVVWGSLLYEDPAITEDLVGRVVHMGNMEYVCERLAIAMGGGEEGEEKLPDPATAGDNGKPSLPVTDG